MCKTSKLLPALLFCVLCAAPAAAQSTAPVTSVASPADGAYLNSLSSIDGTVLASTIAAVSLQINRVSDGLYWDGSAWAAPAAWLSASVSSPSWTYSSLPSWTNGVSYRVYARAEDPVYSGVVDYSTSTFHFDTGYPSAALTSPVHMSTVASLSGLAGTAYDAESAPAQVWVTLRRVTDDYYWNGAISQWTAAQALNLASGTTSWSYAGVTGSQLAYGTTYYAFASAVDLAGNVELYLSSSSFVYVGGYVPEPVLSSAPFSGVSTGSLTVNWLTTYSTPTVYYALLSTTTAAEDHLRLASTTASGYNFGGLSPATVYYGFVSTIPGAGYIPSGSGTTLAAAPSSAAFSGVWYSSAAVSWYGANPAGTQYYWEVAASSSFSPVLAVSSGAALSAWLTGLDQGATYYLRVSAYNSAGAASGYAYAGPAVTRRLMPSGLPGTPYASAVGTSSVAWNWGAGGLSAADYLALYFDGVFTATAPASDVSALQQGLQPNTTHFLALAGRNSNGETGLAVSSYVYTLAAEPREANASFIGVSTAVLVWDLNGNPDGTVMQLWRSADGANFSSVYAGAAQVYAESGLEECATYYYRLRAVNGAGVFTGLGPELSFVTQASTPSAPSGLYAEALAGGRIALSWDPSPSRNAAEYRVYYDSASGVVDYSAPYAVLASTALSWTTPALTPGYTYRFALRAVSRCGIAEANTSVLASAQAAGSLSGVRAAIKSPQGGKRINGNSVTVVAELTLGAAAQVSQVRFQYRLSGNTVWTDITAANAAHPNPDASAPYFTHWDADAMAAGVYELRAVAADLYGSEDQAPPAITVTIDHADYDVNEDVSGGELQKEQKISSTVSSTVQAADESTAMLAKLVIPAGAVSADTATVTLVSNPSSKPAPPSGSEDLSLAVKINLSNGQSQLSGGNSASVTISYRDENGDGVLDGTAVRADRLRMYTSPDGGGSWTALATSVNLSSRTITGTTTHFSYFSAFAAPASTLSDMKAYPNPWQPGSGGGFDSSSGVTFSGLPASARIKIFTIMGELVRALEVTAADAGTKVWDGRNTEGHKAVSGVYLVRIKSGSSEKILKLAVER